MLGTRARQAARQTVEEIERALARIEANQYGYCEMCGDRIPVARLEAIPWALSGDGSLASPFFQGNKGDTVLFRTTDYGCGREGIAEVVTGDDRRRLDLDHPRSGEALLVSQPNSWQAYYWWLDDWTSDMELTAEESEDAVNALYREVNNENT